MDLNIFQIIGITLIIIMLSTIIISSADKQAFYNFTLPIIGKNYDLKLSTFVKGFKKSNEEQSSEEPSSEEPSSEEPVSKKSVPTKPLEGLYKSKQIYLEQFPKMRIINNERKYQQLPDEPTMRKILEDLSNSGILY